MGALLLHELSSITPGSHGDQGFGERDIFILLAFIRFLLSQVLADNGGFGVKQT